MAAVLWLQLVVCRCQVLAGRVLSETASNVLLDLEQLVGEVPEVIEHREQLLARTLLTQTLGRMILHYRLDFDPILNREFLILATCPAGATWRARWQRVAAACAAAARPDAVYPRLPISGHDDQRVRRILRALETHHAEPHLALKDIAKDIGLSPWYVARLLRRFTGTGFLDHLHRCRVLAARAHLMSGALSMKETAAAVGYTQQGQLSRHFRQVYGVTPREFRAAHLTRAT